jgi:UDP-sugar transporter A1/2/3
MHLAKARRSEYKTRSDRWHCVPQGLLTTASKSNGSYRYNFATVPLLAEILKLLISSMLLQRQKHTSPEAARVTRHWRTAVLFLVPSIIYWLHNNVQFVTLKYVDPATYQIMGNLKIVTTGLLLWICLKRQLSLLQWLALALLMIGATVSQVLPLLPLLACNVTAPPLFSGQAFMIVPGCVI